MAAACDALGVSGHRILDAPDRGVADVDAEWAVREILADIGATVRRSCSPSITWAFPATPTTSPWPGFWTGPSPVR